jgi:uncharacterized membrane protein (DUF4010 family)
VDSLIARLGLALAIGLLVGLERGWRERDAPDGSRTAGIRTFGISGLLGGILATLANALGAISVLVGGFIVFAAIFAWYKAREAAQDRDFSVTSVIAGLAVFALGALAVVGDYRAAAAGGAALAAILASREKMHGLLRRMTWIELRSALVLAIMTAIVLPLLPNRTMDPWGGFNPREVWFLTVLMATISFAGYVAVRVLGNTRGLLLSSLAGAVVSSTAVTLGLARNSKSAINRLPLAGAASLAAMVSVSRVCAVILLLQPDVFKVVAIPAIAGALAFAACGAFMFTREGGDPKNSAEPRNPFELVPLLLFALLFAVVATTSAALAVHFGGHGLVVSSALAAMFDVDVSVLSALRLIQHAIPVPIVGHAVLAALAGNAAGRVLLAGLVSPPGFWLPLAASTLIAATAGYCAMIMLATG